MAKITILPNDITVEATSGTEFLQLSSKYPDLPLRYGCKKGNCGKCAVEIKEGQNNLTKQSEQEVMTLEKKGFDPKTHRLACQCAFNGDVTVVVH